MSPSAGHKWNKNTVTSDLYYLLTLLENHTHVAFLGFILSHISNFTISAATSGPSLTLTIQLLLGDVKETTFIYFILIYKFVVLESH